MKSLFILIFCCFSSLVMLSSCSTAKEDKRPSPLMADSTKIGPAKVKVVYSSPAVKDRKIWNDLVPFGEIWRTGANSATRFSSDYPLLVGYDTLPKGEYAMFTIPDSTFWTVIFNGEEDQWGAFNYNEKLDVLRVNVNTIKIDSSRERMAFFFDGDSLIFNWESLAFALPLQPLNIP